MAKRKNIRIAGRLMTGVVYSVANSRDTEQKRAQKTQVSTLARERMNLKYSWQKLEWLMAANFDYRDQMLTLTYDKDHTPENRAEAIKHYRKWIKAVRSMRREVTGEAVLYIYCTEGQHGDKRLHHHLIINGGGTDNAKLAELWPYGNVDFEPIGKLGYTKLAQYLTKEPREQGIWEVGERTWIPSMHLKRPKPDRGWCPDSFTLTPPPGATVLFSDTVHNEWGEYSYLKCLLPPKVEDLPVRFHRPKRRRKQPEI